ncbi:MAG: hypothetical protein U0X86_000910 [Wolbachia endosymbiont of Xenopsylla cheopis]
MKSIQKYLKKNAVDGTVSKVAGATLLLFNLAYFFSLSISQAGKKVDLNFLKDAIGSMTYFYIIASSVILLALASSFIFHKIKTKQSKYDDEDLFYNKIDDLLSNDKKGEIEKVTISFDHNGLMIMPNKNVIEIPVSNDGTTNCESPKKQLWPTYDINTKKSIYPTVQDSKRVEKIMKKIEKSRISFFKHNELRHHESLTLRQYKDSSVTLLAQNSEIPANKFFQFTDLYNINSIKIHYTDCSSTEVKLKLKEELAVNMELYEYINANRPHPLSNIKEPQIAFIPAIAGNRPIFSGEVLLN